MQLAQLWHSILFWVTLHPTIAYMLVLLISLAESLAIVGLLVPGSMMMVGIGAMVGSGAISLALTLSVASVGAIVGDGISYWLGHHYHQEIRRLWPFNHHPRLIAHGEAFFYRHGGKSVFLARFVGPVRPVVPMIAGMVDLAPKRFFLANILSAIVWACAYIAPGLLFARIMPAHIRIDTRTALLLVVLGVVLWLFIGAGKRKRTGQKRILGRRRR